MEMKPYGKRRTARRRKYQRRAVSILAAIVVFATTYHLILPAITLETDVAKEEPGIVIEDAEQKNAPETEELSAVEETPAPAEDADEPEEPAAEPDGDAAEVREMPYETDESDEPEEEPAGEAEQVGEAIKASILPAQRFEGETDDVKVTAAAPEGAFPAGTTMTVTAVKESEIIDAVSDAVEGDVVQVQAVDITFYNADGEEIKPAGEIIITLASKVIAEVEEPIVVHVDDAGKAEVVEQVNQPSAEDEVVFKADAFFVYAIVETDNVKVSTITATTTDGASVEITGRLPKGAEASITPVALTTDELVSYYGESVINAVDNIVVYDICILVDGEEWEPDETVSVIIKSPAIETKESNEEVTVTHLIDEDMSAEKMDTELTDDGSISFETEGFSLWGLYTFTVDFYFGEQEYHMPGNTQMLLSELFEKLEIESPISDVINVTFSDENLLQIEKNENDWTLTSLLPFDTDENLQVELADGTILTILTKDKLYYPTYTYESEWLQPYVGTFREFGHIDIFGGGNGIACMSRENQVNEENWAARAKGAANNSTSTNYTYDQWTKGSWGGGTSFLNDSFDQDYSYQNTSSPKLFGVSSKPRT